MNARFLWIIDLQINISVQVVRDPFLLLEKGVLRDSARIRRNPKVEFLVASVHDFHG